MRPKVSVGTNASGVLVNEYLEAQRLTLTNVNSPRLTIGFKVRPLVYLIYHNLDKEKKRKIREILEATILAFGRMENKVETEKAIINLNININEVKAESKAANIQYNNIIVEVREFLEKLINPGMLYEPPKWVKEKARELLKKMS